MTRGMENRRLGMVVLGILAVFLTSAVTTQARQEDLSKKYADIIGAYEFDFEGQLMVIKFWIEEDKLVGAPEGEVPEELVPVAGEPMKFEVTTADGQYFELEFLKDDSGEVVKCRLATQGMELEGIKIKK